MVATVMGLFKKPYRLDNGKAGVSCRISLHCGEYLADPANNEYAAGDQFIEVKCPENIVDQLSVNDEIYVDLDDGKSRVKSAMFKNPDGGYIPIG